jgi:hypothetical protein
MKREQRYIMEIESLTIREEAIEVVIPISVSIPWLMRLTVQLEEILRDDDSRGIILNAVYSCDSGTVITVMLASNEISNLVIKLAFMHTVDKVVEDSIATGTFSSFADRRRILLIPEIKHYKRLYLILKEASIPRW